MNKKNTSRCATRATIMICTLIFVAGHVFGLGADILNDRPVYNEPSWPEGMVNLVNTTNRVHGFFVNDEDIFFFSGSATNLTAFLAGYSQIQGVEKHRLILHEGVGEAKSPWENTGRACDWELDGCSKWYRDLVILASHATNSLELTQQANQGTNYGHVLVGTNGAIKIIGAQKAGPVTNYVLEVHFWTGGKIVLDDVTIPKNVEVNISDGDKSSRLATEANEVGVGNSVTTAIPPSVSLQEAVRIAQAFVGEANVDVSRHYLASVQLQSDPGGSLYWVVRWNPTDKTLKDGWFDIRVTMEKTATMIPGE